MVFNTSIFDETLKTQFDRLEQERYSLINIVSETLKKIREEYGIRSAYIIGSLVHKNRWHKQSDIDVAVSGCSKHILSIMKELEDMTDRQVDVIDLESSPLSEPLVQSGIKVYG